VIWVWFGVVRTSETPAGEVRASFAGRCVAPVLWAWTTEEPFDGEHIFEIEELERDRVRFVQREVFEGLLVPLLARNLDRDTQRGFKERNQTLRERIELGDQNDGGR
jgi:hypothetical protein